MFVAHFTLRQQCEMGNKHGNFHILHARNGLYICAKPGHCMSASVYSDRLNLHDVSSHSSIPILVLLSFNLLLIAHSHTHSSCIVIYVKEHKPCDLLQPSELFG